MRNSGPASWQRDSGKFYYGLSPYEVGLSITEGKWGEHYKTKLIKEMLKAADALTTYFHDPDKESAVMKPDRSGPAGGTKNPLPPETP